MSTKDRTLQRYAETGLDRPRRRHERTAVPATDIEENSDQVVLRVDLPGVSEQSARVTVENRVLTIHGEPQVQAPDGYSLVRADQRFAAYWRSFELSEDLDTSGMKASMKNGVLTITIPRRAEARARKIDVTTE